MHDGHLHLHLASPDGGGSGSQHQEPPDVGAVDGGYGEVVVAESSDCSRSDGRDLSRRSPAAATGGIPRFPVKAFAQMCLGGPSGTLRLESHVVETLVLGCGLGHTDVPPGAGSSASFDGDDVVALSAVKRDALEAICEFHGTQGWTCVDGKGLVGSGEAESGAPWQEVVWEWYDARF